MIVSENWDENILLFTAQDTFLTLNVVEADPGYMNGGPQCIKYECGDDLETFDYDKFAEFAKIQKQKLQTI